MTDNEIIEIKWLATQLASENNPGGKLANMVLKMFHMHPSQLEAGKGGGVKSSVTVVATQKKELRNELA